MKLRIAFTLFTLLFACSNIFAQTDGAFLMRTIGALEKYNMANPVEKVYLHLDKADYMPGDTIWFKAYAVAGENHGLSAISNVVHVELLNDADSVINRIAVPLSSGTGWADFDLPVLMKQGNYHIRAYTNWMRNYAPDYFFDQHISIREKQAALVTKKQKPTGDPDVQFFPEGGALINGLRSKIAIKSVSTTGLGEDVDGSVRDNDGNEVAVFSTQHLGMGVFALIPQAGKSYKAKITRKNGAQLSVNLPKAQDDGFAITVNNNQPDSISIRIAASAKLFETKKGASYYLLAQCSAKTFYTANFKLLASSFTTRIDKKRFPTGIVQFTLFADNGEPLLERIVFIQHDDALKLQVKTAKEVYGSRQKVDIKLQGTDKDNKPVIGSFSASVINQDLINVNEAYENSIFGNLLLTSDIKGFVQQPAYYFTDVSDKKKADLDLLMLTQGYHRFEWKQVINGTLPALMFEPENSLTVSGTVQTPGGKPVPNAKVMLYSTKGGWFKLDTLANEQGKFTFKGLVTDQDTAIRYLIQGRTATNGKNVVTGIDTIAPFKKWKNRDSFNGLLADTSMLTPYQQQMTQQLKVSLDKRTILLKEVSIREVKVPLSGNFVPDQTIRIPKDAIGGTVAQYLSAKLAGVIFKNGLPYSMRNGAMNIVLDGVKIDPEYFAMLNLNEIEGVEVLRSKGRVDMNSNLGNVIILTRRKFNGYTKQVTPDVITFLSNGFYKAKEFYSPKYDVQKANAQVPDLRTTIYWKPDIVTDKDGNASISFFNSDTKGTYRVTVEGIDNDGNIGRQVYTYKVE